MIQEELQEETAAKRGCKNTIEHPTDHSYINCAVLISLCHCIDEVSNVCYVHEREYILLRQKLTPIFYSGNDLCTHTLLTPDRKVLEKLIVPYLINKSPHFMETQSSLPCSYVPATCPYPEPD
jgi:hypothetical protein